MGVIWTSKTRTQQPNGILRINRASPLTRGLVRLYSPNTGAISREGTSPVVLGSASRVAAGKLINTASNATAPTIGAIGEFSGASAYTMLCIATPAALAVRMPLMGWDDLTGTVPFGFGCGYSNSDQVFTYLDGSNYVAEAIPGFFVVNERHLYAITASAAAGVTFYKDGVGTAGTIVGSFANAPTTRSLVVGGGALNGSPACAWNGSVELGGFWNRVLTSSEIAEIVRNPWQLFAPEKRPLYFSTAAGANNTGTLAITLDAATLTGVGGVARSGTLATTLDAATLTGVGNVTRSGTLAVTLDAATLAGTGAVTTSGTLAVTLDAVTLAGVGSVAVGTNRDGTLAVTLDAATLAGIGAVTRTGTLAVTLDAATLAGVGTAGQAITGTLGVTLGNVTLAGIGAIPAAPSAGGGKTFGSNKKKKKQRKAIESEEWLKAEETAKQLLQDRFTKTTPEAKLEALATHIESLQPVIDALKALAREDVQESVQETRTEEVTEHQLVLNRFDALEKKIESVEELLIILMADL